MTAAWSHSSAVIWPRWHRTTSTISSLLTFDLLCTFCNCFILDKKKIYKIIIENLLYTNHLDLQNVEIGLTPFFFRIIQCFFIRWFVCFLCVFFFSFSILFGPHFRICFVLSRCLFWPLQLMLDIHMCVTWQIGDWQEMPPFFFFLFFKYKQQHSTSLNWKRNTDGSLMFVGMFLL